MRLLLFLLLVVNVVRGEEKPFVFVLHNATEECLSSIFNQKYGNYRVICVQDGAGAEKFDERMLLIHNREAMGHLACLCQGVYLCDRNEIVVELEGDARLDHDRVLAELNELYADGHLWMTTDPTSFYAALFDEIPKMDLLDGGQAFKVGDSAYLVPMTQRANRSGASLNMNAAPPIYQKISDILHPSITDYYLIQEFLSHGERKNLARLGDEEKRMRNIKIIGEVPDEIPTFKKIHINCNENDRGNCILIFCTFNQNYQRGLQRLLKHVLESEYKGHIMLGVGGWPNVEGGSLPLAHVPNAFKVALFKEAERLGFKRALWLDTAVVPLVNLNDIFAMIGKKGYFIMHDGEKLGKFMNPASAAFFGLTHAKTYQIDSCSGELFGIDLATRKGKNIIDWWYRAAFDEDAFFSVHSDQNALSMILYLKGYTDFLSKDRFPQSTYQIKDDSLFLLDRAYIH